MQINRDQRGWMIGTVVATAALALGYAAYIGRMPAGPSGGSWPGLGFGVLGTACMVLAALLSARKSVRTWRLGSAQAWMRLHVWLGLLAVPCIWFHSGFGLGGALTTAIMSLFYVVIVSGLIGLALQQVVPAATTRQVPSETVLGQIDHVLAGLAVDAYELVASLAGPLAEAAEEQQRLKAEAEVLKRQSGYWKQVARLRPAEASDGLAGELRAFYLATVRPYLQKPSASAAPPDCRALLLHAPEEWRPRLDRLQALCEEARQLAVQRRLHVWLHGWLFIHAPLSFALFALVAVHIVHALRY